MANATHQLYSVKRMENTRIAGDDKTNGRILHTAGQTLGRGVRPKLQLPYDLLHTLGDLFINCRNFIKNARNGSDGYIRLSGDISYTYFFFNHGVMNEWIKG